MCLLRECARLYNNTLLSYTCVQSCNELSDNFPLFTLNGCSLSFVQQFKYLGHIISNTLNDDDDIKREIRNLVMRTNNCHAY